MLDHIETGKFRGRTVGVVLGGDSNEREISLRTGRAFAEALRSLDYDVRVYDVPADIPRLVADRPAAVLLGLHGGTGENGTFQGFLETLEIPYTGSGVLASALAMDKARAKAILAAHDIRTPKSVFVTAANAVDAHAIGLTVGFPAVAKLNDSGSSHGVFLCKDEQELADALQTLAPAMAGRESGGILVEEYVDGPEYTVGFFDGQYLGSIQVVAGNAFYDYEAKYASQTTRYEPVTDSGLEGRLEAIGRATFATLGCQGVARVDVMARGDELFVLEVNTIPGMTETSLIPKMAKRLGMPFADFTERLLSAASLKGRF